MCINISTTAVFIGVAVALVKRYIHLIFGGVNNVMFVSRPCLIWLHIYLPEVLYYHFSYIETAPKAEFETDEFEFDVEEDEILEP